VSLLAIEKVSKCYRRGSREYLALQEVSLEVERGELLVVLGTRKSGRSTLLRIAAGLERPDEGIVRFEGKGLRGARDVVGRQIAYCHTGFSPMEGERTIDHVAATLLARRISLVRARRAAERALDRTNAGDCAGMRAHELNAAERVRVGLARALVGKPSVLVSDDPNSGVSMLESDGILRLLRTVANDGVAVLMSTDDATSISGADRALSLDRGKLRCDVEGPRADVVPLRPRTLQSEARLG